MSFRDKNDHPRSEARIRWWRTDATDLADMVIGTDNLYEATRACPAQTDALPGYHADEPPVFFGHYWLTGRPELQGPNVACLDYSVARDGKLVAYRWDGEQTLEADRFIW